MEKTETGLDLIQPDDTLSDQNMVPHVDPAHVCFRGCYGWHEFNPDFGESCGDEA